MAPVYKIAVIQLHPEVIKCPFLLVNLRLSFLLLSMPLQKPGVHYFVP